MIKIYGVSDDLIEIEGDLVDEICPSEDDGLIALSTGEVVSFKYNEMGCWEFRLYYISDTTTFMLTHVPHGGPEAERREDGTPGYSDVITLDYHGHKVNWIMCGERFIVKERR